MKNKVVSALWIGVWLICLSESAVLGMGIGDTVKVTASLNVRTGPSTPEITDTRYPGQAPAGTLGKIVAGPQSANGYTWWRVDFGPGLYSGGRLF